MSATGTGKTLVSIRTADELGARLALFVVPTPDLSARTALAWLRDDHSEHMVIVSSLDASGHADLVAARVMSTTDALALGGLMSVVGEREDQNPRFDGAAGITASTLRGYISRGENDVPLPPSDHRRTIPVVTPGRRRLGGSPAPLLRGAEGRQVGRRPAPSRPRRGSHPRPLQRDRLQLPWKRPDIGKRWGLRHRNKPSVREVADQLAFEVADSLRRIIPTDALGPTVRHAVLQSRPPV